MNSCNLRGLHYQIILVHIDLKFKCLLIIFYCQSYSFLRSLTFLPVSLSLLTLVLKKFPRVNELGSSTLLLDDIAYEETPLSLSEFNKNSGLFLSHQEIDSAQHNRLGKVIFIFCPTQSVR